MSAHQIAATLTDIFAASAALAATHDRVGGATCPAGGRSVLGCALCAATAPPWMATGLLGAVVALAVTGVLLAAVLWRGLPVKRTRDWAAIVLCGVVGTGGSVAWATYILRSLLGRPIPFTSWWAAVAAAGVVLLWGRREASREVARRRARLG
jgi:hypothetical protein